MIKCCLKSAVLEEKALRYWISTESIFQTIHRLSVMTVTVFRRLYLKTDLKVTSFHRVHMCHRMEIQYHQSMNCMQRQRIWSDRSMESAQDICRDIWTGLYSRRSWKIHWIWESGNLKHIWNRCWNRYHLYAEISLNCQCRLIFTVLTVSITMVFLQTSTKSLKRVFL